MIGDALSHLHKIGAHEFAGLPKEIPQNLGTSLFYSAILHAMLNDSRRFRVDKNVARFLRINGKEEIVYLPLKVNAHDFARGVLKHNDIVCALFRNGATVAVSSPSSPITLDFYDPTPLTWNDLISAGQAITVKMRSSRFLHRRDFFMARWEALEPLVARSSLIPPTLPP